MRVPLLVVALSAVAFAGCFGDEPLPAQRGVSASGGKTSDGWAYDGAGVAGGSATLEGTLDNEQNTGTLTVTFDHQGSKYVVTFDQFAQTKDFMQGGIAFETPEHGDTNVGDASIPTIHAHVAAWGTATVTRDGAPVVGSAGDRWSAHLMVSRDTVRGSDNKITKADGAAPYDPAAPTDARRVENDPQALFFVKHPDGETAKREPATGSATLTFQGPAATQTTEVPAEKGAASVVINVTATGGAAPVGVGQISVSVKDAEGTEVAGQGSTNVLPNAPFAASFDIPIEKVTGPLTVEITGQGTFSVVVDHVVTYDDHPFIVVTWDEVTFT